MPFVLYFKSFVLKILKRIALVFLLLNFCFCYFISLIFSRIKLSGLNGVK